MAKSSERLPPSADGESRVFRVGNWRVEPDTGRITKHDGHVVLEPKVMDLLVLLSREPGRVLSRSDIENALWPDTIVGDDTVARAVSRLRRALGDSAQAPSFIETFPKRGYRLLAAVEREADVQPAVRRDTRRRLPLPALLFLAFAVAAGAMAALTFLPASKPVAQADVLSERAGDLYMRFTRADNEAAIVLYERALAADKDHAGAQAGLANALVQRVVRWPHQPGAEPAGAGSLAEALDAGLTKTPAATDTLTRAAAMAERAVRLAPRDPDALKALGLTLTAQGDLDGAERIYRQAIGIDEDAWESLTNLGEIHLMRGDRRGAVAAFEQAYAAMGRAYEREPQRIGPWQVALGVVIGESYETLEQTGDAELWYRRVLAEAPLEPEATTRLARLLHRSGERGEALRLCKALTEKVGRFSGCELGRESPVDD